MIGDQIQNLGPDVIESATLVRDLGLTQEDFVDPARVMKAKEIMDYLHGMPDKSVFIQRSGVARSEDKLSRLWEYTMLHKQKGELSKKIKDLEDSISRYER